MDRIIAAKQLLSIAKEIVAADSEAEKKYKEVSKVFYDWAHRLGVTGAKESAQMVRAMMKGKTLGQAAEQVFSRIEREKRNYIGDDLYNQMESEGKIRDPRKRPEHHRWLNEHREQQ